MTKGDEDNDKMAFHQALQTARKKTKIGFIFHLVERATEIANDDSFNEETLRKHHTDAINKTH